MTQEQIKQGIYQEAKAYNKVLTDEYLDQFDLNQLLSFTHPLYRLQWHLRIARMQKNQKEN